jgi:DNA polymerase epsilon subunit 1
MDRANFGGVEDMANEKIVSHWNIADYLPKAIQEYFLITITDYMLQTYKAYKAHPRTEDTPDTAPSNQPDGFDEHSNAKPNSIIANLTPRLFAIIQDIQRTLSGDHSQANEASSEFPKLAGSHLPMNNPALEFIKFVCHVLSLDRSLEHDVNRLKKNLLRLINVREFASEANFVNPCLSYVLPDVMCEFCNYGRDLDLLRDAPTSSSGAPSFACTSCGHPYNRKHMEATLVEIVQKRDLGYQLQDLVCSKCRAVKAANMGDICTQCSGQWVCKMPLHAFKKRFVVFTFIVLYGFIFRIIYSNLLLA